MQLLSCILIVIKYFSQTPYDIMIILGPLYGGFECWAELALVVLYSVIS